MTEIKTKKIAILGSTGSIGCQALEVIQAYPSLFEIILLTSHTNSELLTQQTKNHTPKHIVLTQENTTALQYLKNNVGTSTTIHAGMQAVIDILQAEDIDIVLTSMVGYAGLAPTIAAVEKGMDIALANKETLVVAGELIQQKAAISGSKIYPVDSEHSALFQCLVGENPASIEKLILTASGGPFRGKKIQELQHITPAQALKHPNWTMGSKITIDSATLMNKGLEVIEAKWLFGVEIDQIETIVHPQSIVHSLVQFKDGSIKAQLGLPDMKLPIHYALFYPDRVATTFPRFSFLEYPTLSFEPTDMATFLCLDLAFQAIKKGGNMPCILNAANEVAVQLFLEEKISFLDIPRKIQQAMDTVTYIYNPTYEDLKNTHESTLGFFR